ncbi:hypothetical protein BC936DRAFT_141781 [Jimgerdemannia flammicorona]|uniref:Uncharacterized protein n=1 Tax=Jimgerdemannia flammicorona TaxID=994334 RepID=A0A433DMG6_9FUNG|nr:hypothetical protein BC936DRAFT_141781 [Jimgerdemannia flammicorona]
MCKTTVSTRFEKKLPIGLLNFLRTYRAPRLNILLKTYPRPSLLGIPPSEIAKTVRVFLADFPCIFSGAGKLTNAGEDGHENIRVVVRRQALQAGHEALKTQAGVNVLIRKESEAAILLTIELHEHQIPNFKNIWVILIYQRRRIAAADTIEMDFRAGTARTGFTHF